MNSANASRFNRLRIEYIWEVLEFYLRFVFSAVPWSVFFTTSYNGMPVWKLSLLFPSPQATYVIKALTSTRENCEHVGN